MRTYPPFFHGQSAPFAILNRGKRALAADLRVDADRAQVEALVARADVLVEQFRPGVLGRFGLDYPTLRVKNPRLVYCSITGYGQEGPRRDEAGHDLNYIGATGLLALSPGPIEHPVVPPALIADIGGGSFPAVINILLALIARERTGEGTYLDVAMTDAMFTFGWMAWAMRHATGRGPAPGELFITGSSPRYQLYPTSDGRLVACGAIEQKFWTGFCAAIGLDPKHVDDFRDPAATKQAVATIIRDKPASHWRPRFHAADCCATIVASLEEALADPHFIARGMFDRRVALPDGTTLPGLPLPIAPILRVDDEVKPFPPPPAKPR